jgi:alanine racemase
MRCRNVHVVVNLARVRAAAEAIRRQTGVRLIAVIKADAYGLGAAQVAGALSGAVHEFAYFSIHEAREVGRPGIVLGPPEGDAAQYHELNLRPAVATRADAERFAGIPVAVKLDTGMQRFGCRPEDLADLLARCQAQDVFTHAVGLPSTRLLREVCRGRSQWLHAASTSLLGNPEAWLDGVRPGLALYRGAVRVSTRLHSVRHTTGGVGYTQFEHPHVGVILAGYCNHLHQAPVLINGRRQRLLEVGMNTAFVSVDPSDHPGDEVVLLGDGLTEAELAARFDCREHEILCRYTAMGARSYITADGAAPLDRLVAAKLDSACTTQSTAAAPPRT